MEFISNRRIARFIAVSVAMGVLIVIRASAYAQDTNEMPFDTPTQVNGIEAVCTGVSLDAREDPRWNSYPLKVEIAGKGGQYLGDVRVTVISDGQNIFDVACGGPWLLFRLSPARYQITAATESETASSTAFVPASGQGRIIIRFPELGGALEKGTITGSPAGF